MLDNVFNENLDGLTSCLLKVRKDVLYTSNHGSSPCVMTNKKTIDMKLEISNYYKEKGYKAAYLIHNKENRNMCCLVHNNGDRLTISYAKYLYTSFYCVDIVD